MNKKERLLLGAHLSIAHGFAAACEEAQKIGCSTMQIFTKSNRQWKAKDLDPKEVALYLEAQKVTKITPVVAHACYLINIGSPDNDIRAASIQALVIELDRCATLNIPYLIVHPGSHVKSDETACLERIADALNEVISLDHHKTTTILLETMSGQGSTVCYTFEQLASIRKRIHNEKLFGICLDTCHIFAAGYDIRTKQGYTNVFQMYGDILGLETIKTIHLNDSKKACGSRIDRHAHIGKGDIGTEVFKLLLNDERFFAIPKIIETPIDDQGGHEMNLKFLKSLITEETRSLLYME